MDNCGGQSYDGAGNMAGRYAGALTLIQHQFPKFILLLDKFLLVETSHANCWIHPWSQKENNNRIPFTLTFHPHNHAVKSIILKNFKLLQNDPDTGRIFSQPPLISFKRDKNIGNFLVRSAFQTSNQAGTFKCARARCKTYPFICNVEKLSGPKRSIKITYHFTCTSTDVIYCITCTLCKKLIHRRNRETTRRQIPRTPSRRRERRQKLI